MTSTAVQPAGKPLCPPPELPDFLAVRVERYYRERVRDTWGGRHILHGRGPGPEALHLSSNDYLALSRHPRILTAMAGTLARDGNGMLMSGIFLHGDSPQLEFGNNLAHFMQAQARLLCQSGFFAKTRLVPSVAHGQTPVYADVLAPM